MKRIEFIAPVESMRGNLSGNQNLNYGAADGKAYDQEVGKVTAANNYDPRFVGAKRSRDGYKYFQVRTKSAIGLTSKSKRAMALLAGSAACFLAASKTLSILTQLQQAFLEAKGTTSLTFRKWLQGLFYEMLANKQLGVVITYAGGSVSINNPWTGGQSGSGHIDLTIPVETMVKFASELTNTAVFSVTIGDKHFVTEGELTGGVSDYTIWNVQRLKQKYNEEPIANYPGEGGGTGYRLQVDLMSRKVLLIHQVDGTADEQKVINYNGAPVMNEDHVVENGVYTLTDFE